MQSSYQLKLSAAQQELLVQQPDLTSVLLEEAIENHAEQLGYMLQAYYPGEKVSKVTLIPGSISLGNTGSASLKLEYIMEQFNVCSAIDTEQKDKMTVMVSADQETGVLNLTGESWPEL